MSTARPTLVPGFPDFVLPAGTRLYHGTRAIFGGLPSHRTRSNWFGFDRDETAYYTNSQWKLGDGPPRIIEAVATRELRLPNVRNGYDRFFPALGAAVPPSGMSAEAAFAAVRAAGLCGWAVSSTLLGASQHGAVALVDPAACGIVYVGEAQVVDLG